MVNHTVPCRVCGKPFVPCNTSIQDIGVFNYRTVACSPECGVEYLRRVQASRQKSAEQVSSDTTVSAVKNASEDAIVETPKQTTRGRKRVTKAVEE